ncbi:MAG: glutathione S-transferase [Gammaproteobacteria bacterium]|jgi:glutathione S-transferase|tara:strand:+ start:22 stop:405 length:384 start_codon:yes stop_codon:yes gene_type:complete
MELVYVVMGCALLQFFAFGMLAGVQRMKTGVEAPAISGNDIFERYFRVHYNTMEQLVIFVPAIYLYGTYISVNWAAGLGVVFIIGRFVYLKMYIANPKKRGIGFGLTMVPNTILLLGGIGGAAARLL